MALPGVSIEISNGNLGAVTTTDDSVCGLIMSGVAVSGKIALNDPKLVRSLADAEALGLNAAYDTTNSTMVYSRIRDFYSLAPVGTKLYIMILAPTVTLTQAADITNVNNALKLINFANGEIKVLGFTRNPGSYTPTITANIDPDVVTAVTRAQALAEASATNGKPLRCVVEGRMVGNTSWNTLFDFHTSAANRVAVMIGGTGTSANNTAVGLLLGRIASLPVQRNIGRAKNATTGVLTAYVGGVNLKGVSEADLSTLYDKGVIFFRQLPGQGFYNFVDDQMAAALTDDFAYLSRGRTIDKAHYLAYVTYNQELLDDVEVDSDGKLPVTYCKALEAEIENVIGTAMAGEISAVSAYIDPAQNVVSTSTLALELNILPRGTTRNIKVTLGLTKSV